MERQLTLFKSSGDTVKAISTEICACKPRLNSPIRNQVEMIMKSLDESLPKDHIARDIWKYVNSLNLSILLKQIRSVEGNAGRPATDPKIYLALWLLGTIKGISSARVLEEYSQEHIAFKWICGGVKVNYHSLSDFRSFQGEQLDELLSQSVAILANNEIISLEVVSQDGMRVRASAGRSSFKKEKSIQMNLELAKMYLSDLKEEAEKNPGACKTRLEAAQKRSAEEKAKNLENALAELKEIRKSKIRGGKTSLDQVKQTDLENAKASITDSDARIMKMADDGYRPAYNVQFATTVKGKAIIGVDVAKTGSDQKQTLRMIKQVENKYGIVPTKWLQDGGYKNLNELKKIGKRYKNCKIYMPLPEKDGSKDKKNLDSKEINEWRERMSTEEAQSIYKKRAETSEFVNAQSRNRGLQQFMVRTLPKVKCVALIYAIVQNMTIALNIPGIF